MAALPPAPLCCRLCSQPRRARKSQNPIGLLFVLLLLDWLRLPRRLRSSALGADRCALAARRSRPTSCRLNAAIPHSHFPFRRRRCRIPSGMARASPSGIVHLPPLVAAAHKRTGISAEREPGFEIEQNQIWPFSSNRGRGRVKDQPNCQTLNRHRANKRVSNRVIFEASLVRIPRRAPGLKKTGGEFPHGGRVYLGGSELESPQPGLPLKTPLDVDISAIGNGAHFKMRPVVGCCLLYL